jgi:hypothetical protein
MEVDKMDNSSAENVLETDGSQEGDDLRIVLDLDQKRYLVLLIVGIATAI